MKTYKHFMEQVDNEVGISPVVRDSAEKAKADQIKQQEQQRQKIEAQKQREQQERFNRRLSALERRIGG